MLLNRRHPLGTLWHEFNQVQDEFTKWFGRTVGNPTDPQLNVWDDENAVYAEVDLPGIDPAKLEITVTEGNQLTVQGERVPPTISGAAWIRQERPFGKFVRVVGLPTLVDAEKVDAKYENEILALDASQARSGQAAENNRYRVSNPRAIAKSSASGIIATRRPTERVIQTGEVLAMSKLIHDGMSQPTAENDSTERSGAVNPRVDVLETENEYLVLADMPGTKPEEVDVRFEQGELSVHGRRATRKDEFTTYHRTFAVADTVAADKITAELKAGVLTIRLPKVESVKPKKIAVNG